MPVGRLASFALIGRSNSIGDATLQYLVALRLANDIAVSPNDGIDNQRRIVPENIVAASIRDDAFAVGRCFRKLLMARLPTCSVCDVSKRRILRDESNHGDR